MNYRFTYDIPKSDIIELRRISFHRAYEQRVDLNGLDWNWTDGGSIHLGFYDETRLICCLRLSAFKDIARFERTTQIPLLNSETAPLVLLSRAATHPDFANCGLHSILRLKALEICRQKKLYNIFGSLEKKSSRLSNALDLGYVIVNQTERWPDSYIQSDGDVVLIQLAGEKKLSIAIDKLQSKYNLENSEIFPENIQLL